MRKRLILGLGTVLLFAWAACSQSSDQSPSAPPENTLFDVADNPRPDSARWAQADELAADLKAIRHPSDGAGAAVLIDGDGNSIERGHAVARQPGNWKVRFRAGELGIALGGGVYFLPEPFWGWSAPQTRWPARLGYTSVQSEAEGVELVIEDLGPMLLVRIAGRALVAGESIVLDYGAGSAGALADLQAERGARLWLAVDGDGDGVRKVLEDSPQIDVAPGPPAMLEFLVRGAARPGEDSELVATVLDAFGNPCPSVAGTLTIDHIPEGWNVPSRLPLEAGRAASTFTCSSAGITRLRAFIEVGGQRFEDEANPLWVGADTPQVLWADLHGHTGLSDGTGTPEDWFRYARDVALLDVAALTDHDHFGVLFLDQHPQYWSRIRDTVSKMHEPGRFVTVLGYEWTSWIHGHRHVLHFADDAPLRSSLDPDFINPRQLMDSLVGQPAMTIAHHTAGEPVRTNWSYSPDPRVEPVVEVLSVHGSSEARDARRTVRGATDGYFVRDQLERGLILGFIGSGDSHDGHPGLPHISPMYGARMASPARPAELGTGGLAAVLCSSRTREAVLSSLRERHTYATSGPRALLQAHISNNPPGSSLARADLPDSITLEVHAIADGHWESIELITSWGDTAQEFLGGERQFHGSFPVSQAQPTDWCYVRMYSQEQGQIISSPFFFR